MLGEAGGSREQASDKQGDSGKHFGDWKAVCTMILNTFSQASKCIYIQSINYRENQSGSNASIWLGQISTKKVDQADNASKASQ